MLPSHIKLSDNPGPYLQLFIQKREYRNIAVLTDENTLAHCYPRLKEYFPPHAVITVQSGEEHKTLKSCEKIWTAMTQQAMDRHSLLIIIGGGVLGDMGGFCAATFKRGIDFILIPTTLLAMADASIGGKLGIDFNHFKNHIGVFKEPVLNIIDSEFLKTLPYDELKSGFAEVIKHALISDPTLWNEIQSNSFENQPWGILLRHSAEFKSSIVQQDPTENGIRKILNAGHTIGHALESYFLGKRSKIMHGEAVAAGLICEAFIAVKQERLKVAELDGISSYILKTFQKLNIPEHDIKMIAQLCLQDKKNKGNSVLAVLSEGIGKVRCDCEITMDEIVESLTFYRSLQM